MICCFQIDMSTVKGENQTQNTAVFHQTQNTALSHLLFHHRDLVTVETVPPKTETTVLDPRSPEKCDSLLPSLPEESQLFAPPHLVWKGTSEIASVFLDWLMDVKLNTLVDVGNVAGQLLIDVKKLFLCCNILESVQMMSKTNSSSYLWHGRIHLKQSLVWLLQLAEQENMLEQVNRSLHLREDSSQVTVVRDKLTVGVITQRLLMIFLVASQPMTVNSVWKILYGSDNARSCRAAQRAKLVDICSVLESLGLVRKCVVRNGKDRISAFQYTGPQVRGQYLTQEEARTLPAGRKVGERQGDSKETAGTTKEIVVREIAE